MVELPIYKESKQNEYISAIIIFVIVIISIHVLFPRINGLLGLLGIIIYFLFSRRFDKNNKSLGSLILDYQQIKIKTDKEEIIVYSSEFKNVSIVYGGYKGKTIVFNTRTFSGEDNYIKIYTANKCIEYKFFVDSINTEEEIVRMYERWNLYEFDTSNFKLHI